MTELVPIDLEGASAFRTKNYITRLQKNIYDYFRNYLYLNGYAPKKSEVANFFGIGTSDISKHYCELMLAGLIDYDPEKRAEPKLKQFMAGMCRIPFKGEIKKGGIEPTKESLINFFDLVNTSDFTCYRIMLDLKYPYYRVGDYLVLCHAADYKDDAFLLCLEKDKTPILGRWQKRTHDCVLVDFHTGKAVNKIELDVVGEIVGSIRLDIPIEKMFLKNRIKVVDDELDINHLENQ